MTAAELYLSGISITNEGLDWILVINDVHEGQYQSLAGMLPFIPRGIAKTTGSHLIIKNAAGELLEKIDREALETLEDIVEEAPGVDLALVEKLVREHGMKDAVLKILTTDGGPLKAPWSRGPLETNMKRHLGYGPPSKFKVHHDLVWCERHWFAEHGIDVNDAAFGRYVHESDHKRWHTGKGFGRGGQFVKFWRDVKAAEKESGVTLTRLQILEKLAECRAESARTVPLPP